MSEDMTKDIERSQFVDEEQQKVKGKMRENFLWSVNCLNGLYCKVLMWEGIKVEGINRGLDRNIELMHIQNLKTPFDNHPYATIRLQDCMHITFQRD